MTLQRYKEGTKNRTESCGLLTYSDRTAGKVVQAQAGWHAPTKHSRCWGRGLAHLWCLGFTGISCQNKTNNNQIKPQAPFKPKKTKNYLQGFELILKLTFGSRDTDKFPSFFSFFFYQLHHSLIISCILSVLTPALLSRSLALPSLLFLRGASSYSCPRVFFCDTRSVSLALELPGGVRGSTLLVLLKMSFQPQHWVSTCLEPQ